MVFQRAISTNFLVEFSLFIFVGPVCVCLNLSRCLLSFLSFSSVFLFYFFKLYCQTRRFISFFSSQHMLMRFSSLSWLACRNFFACLSSLIHHPCFVFLLAFLTVTPVLLLLLHIFEFLTAMVSHRSLSDSRYPQVSRTLLSILADLNNALVWIVSIRPHISKSSSP